MDQLYQQKWLQQQHNLNNANPYSYLLLFISQANVFTKSALHALKCHGVSTSPILHIDIEGSDVPRKPVTIELTLQAEKPVDGQLKVFSANDCDFTDITDTLESKLHNNVVVFQVEHFSL